MSDIPTLASNVRAWLKDSRRDAYQVHLQEFEDVSPEGKKGYVVIVWATNSESKLVAELRFKITYPWLKIYRCFVLPEAGGNGLTCQMYMVPMAFAAEDMRITMVKAKQMDPNLVGRFGFNKSGVLSLKDPKERDALLEIMDKCYDACENLNKCYEARLSQSQLLVITDNPEDPRWGKFKDFEPVVLDGKNLKAYDRLLEANASFPRVMFDDKRDLTHEELVVATETIKKIVEDAGGEVYVNNQSGLKPYIESTSMEETMECTNERCTQKERRCNGEECYSVFKTFA